MSQPHPFRVKARILRLLGDELIRDPGLAVFELVKNAYDADAKSCDVTLTQLDDLASAKIAVQDNGCGMTAKFIRDVWLVIGTGFREEQRAERKRTALGRFPLGNKGLGRLAVHKLGRKITVVTRVAQDDEVVVELDWDQLEKAGDINDTAVSVRTREPEIFKGKSHGTKIEVRELREAWDKPKARNLQRAVTSLCSPFRGPDDFEVRIELKPKSDWLDGLLDPAEVRERALYHVQGEMRGSKLTYHYEFRPWREMIDKLKSRGREKKEHNLARTIRDSAGRKKVDVLDLDSIQRIGKKPVSIGCVQFEFYIFDLETEVLKLGIDDVRGFKGYLKENGGVRVYRDGIRVFDFGQPGNDWLNLDGRRVNEPVGSVGNRQILGVVVLDGETSEALVEKSNREGFIENEAYRALQDALLCALKNIEADRIKDQKQVRLFYSRRGVQRPVLEEIAELREALKETDVYEEMEPKLKAIEKQFEAFQDTMLRAASPGLTSGAIVHEAEKIVKELLSVVREDGDTRRIKLLVEQLSRLIDGLGDLFRRSGTAREKASNLVQQALFNCDFRFRAHRIEVVNGLELGNPDFTVECSRRLVVASLMNFIDNSIYWLQATDQKVRRIYVGTSRDLDEGPCIVVADNGPGLQDEPVALVQPFFSRRPDSMGLGLYLADQAAQWHVHDGHKGRLVFPAHGEVSLPRGFDGAVVAFQFPKQK